MTAVSAFAPTRRNPFLRYAVDTAHRPATWWLLLSSTTTITKTTAVALFLLVLSFWRRRRRRRDENSSFSSIIWMQWMRKMMKSTTSRCCSNKNNNQQEEHTTTILSTTTIPSSSSSSSSSLDTAIRENNRQLIHKVLMYWFGQYSPDVAQKKLWMIADSSVEWRSHVDADIALQFAPLLLELSSSNNNKNKQQQQTSQQQQQQLLQQQHNMYQQWIQDSLWYGYQGKIAAIIVLDQMSRHVRRHIMRTSTTAAAAAATTHEQENSGNLSSSSLSNGSCDMCLIPEQSILDDLAYQASVRFQQEHAMELSTGIIPLPMQVFALMPLRHANTIATVQQVQEQTEHMASLQPQLESLIQRFRKATNRRMAVLQDEERRQRTKPARQRPITRPAAAAVNGPLPATNSSNITTEQLNTAAITNDISTNTVTTSHQDGNDNGNNKTEQVEADDDDDDILEHTPFEADMSLSHQHVVHKDMVQFLANRNILPSETAVHQDDGCASMQHENDGVPKKKKKKNGNDDVTTTRPAIVPMIVSLSGGVDSMVVATVLAHLRDHCHFSHLHIAAVHIDYANRSESSAEADYCARYCQQIGISFTCRRIDEVTRGITARDEYERRAREIRYQEYRKAVSECQRKQHQRNTDSLNNKNEGNDSIVGVVLGHHRGDLRENVLSNAHKGCGPLDLSGMTEVSQNDGVTIYRPFLSLEKSAIFDYAHKFGIPYFKDTTPHWSTRGKLRNKLLPLLEEIYGEGSMNNLSTLATESDDARSLLFHAVLGPFLNQVVHRPMGIYFDTAPWKSQGLFFWKLVLREALHNAGLGMFKDKSVASFCERIQAPILRAGWLQCRRDYAVYLQADGRVFVLYPDSFPWRKEDAFSCVGQVVPLGPENAMRVGPWTVMSQIVDPAPNNSQETALLEKKAVASMESLMEGHIEYYLKVPSWLDITTQKFVPRPLVLVAQFCRESRPLAWKSCDLKLQSTLPTLGNDEKAQGVLKELSFATNNNEKEQVGINLAQVTLTLSN